MLALFKGSGRLPDVLLEALASRGETPVICALDAKGQGDYVVQLATLGTLFEQLRARGVTDICLAGAIDRTTLQVGAPDEATKPLLPALRKALFSGDNAALEHLHALFEEQGFSVRAAHEICPDLVPETGILTNVAPDPLDELDVERAASICHVIGPADIGQGCVVEKGQVLAVETLPGTDAMLDQVRGFRAAKKWQRGGVFYKAPKPGQDKRSDLPVIGTETVQKVIAAGLAGIAIEAGGVMVLDVEKVTGLLNGAGAFLWVREP